MIMYTYYTYTAIIVATDSSSVYCDGFVASSCSSANGSDSVSRSDQFSSTDRDVSSCSSVGSDKITKLKEIRPQISELSLHEQTFHIMPTKLLRQKTVLLIMHQSLVHQ